MEATAIDARKTNVKIIPFGKLGAERGNGHMVSTTASYCFPSDSNLGTKSDYASDSGFLRILHTNTVKVLQNAP
jgi:hypothetical protein